MFLPQGNGKLAVSMALPLRLSSDTQAMKNKELAAISFWG